MRCKSGIYATNTAVGSALAVGSTYAPTAIVRRYGSAVNLAADGIRIRGAGYFKVDVVATVTSGAAGTVTATLYKDGQAIPGATSSSVAAADAVVNLPITAIVKNGCSCDDSLLTVVMSGVASTSQNLAITVEKE